MSSGRCFRFEWAALAAGFLLAAGGAQAGTITFNSARATYLGTPNLPILGWSDSANWVPTGIPGVGDDVFLTVTTTDPGNEYTTMSYDVAASLSLNSLTVGGAGSGYITLKLPSTTDLTAGSEILGSSSIITQSGGTNTITGALQLAGEFYTMNGGSLSASTITNSAYGILTLNAGTSVSYQSLTNQATVNFSGGSNPAGAALTNQNGGLLNITGPFGANTPTPSTFFNSGAGTTLSNLSGSQVAVYAGATLENSAGATLTNDGADSVLNVTTCLNCGGAELINDGAGTNFFNQNGATLNVGLNTYTAGLSNQNGATLTNRTGAFIQNYATFINSATLLNQSGAVINNFSAMTNQAGGLSPTTTAWCITTPSWRITAR